MPLVFDRREFFTWLNYKTISDNLNTYMDEGKKSLTSDLYATMYLNIINTHQLLYLTFQYGFEYDLVPRYFFDHIHIWCCHLGIVE